MEAIKDIKKKLVIDSCQSCIVKNSDNGCPAWKKLSKKERFVALTGVGIPKFILNECPLEDEK